MKTAKVLLLCAMVLTIVVFLASCSKDETEATISVQVMASKTTVYPDSATTVTATVIYSGDGVPAYEWTSSGGTITGSDNSVIWTAPATTGSYTVAVNVSDGDVSDSAGIIITVAETVPEDTIIYLSGTITSDSTLTSDKIWILRGGVFVGNDDDETILTIEPGTKIYGESSSDGMLVIRRNSKIMAEGTASQPIVMTSDKPVGSRNRSDWGGLIINGKAPLNTGDEAYGEGGTGYYGGSDPHDDSGILKYVRVEFAGREISPDNELNGIAFQGVGDGTEVDYVQVHMNKDDGIEFFGGTCNIKHAVLTGIADDCFDYTDGWQGKAQFIVAQKYLDDGDQGFEMDNSGEDNTAEPYSNPTIYNFTLIGSYSSGGENDIGVLLREGTKGKFYNGIVMGFQDGLDIDHAQTFLNVENGDLIFDYCIFYNNGVNFMDDSDDFDEDSFATVTMTHNLETTSSPITAPYNLTSPNFRSTGVALTHPHATPPNDGFFDTSVDFIGGVDPNNDWTAGWTTSAPN